MAAPPPPPAHPPQARRDAVGGERPADAFRRHRDRAGVRVQHARAGGHRQRTAWRPTRSWSFRATPAPARSPISCKREGVITQPLLFETYALFNRRRGHLKAGEFQFKAGTSIETAIDTLVEGKAILHSVTIPEGLTSEQIVARLFENDILTGEVAETPRRARCCPTPTSSSAA